jgi:hypothetical protein
LWRPQPCAHTGAIGEPDPDLVDIALRMFTTTHARDWPAFIRLIHPEAEIELRSQPGRVLHGRAEMEQFARTVIAARVAHEATVHEIEQIAPKAVAAIGRLTMTDEQGTRDIPIGWLMLFEEGMLWRSWLVVSIEAARKLLHAFEASPDKANASSASHTERALTRD